jgi:O-antigen ligase
MMSNSVKGYQSREAQKRTTTGWVANATVALLPVLACFLAGATRKWEEGVVIIVLGFYLLLRPPRFSLSTATNLVLFTLVVLAAVSLLPAHWFFQPEWRASLVNSYTIQLPSTLSPQPWITLGYLVSFVAGLSWLYVVSTQDLGLREVRFQLRLFSSGIVLLAAICIAFYLTRITPIFWLNEQNFGPFPNANQTGDLFALAAIMILACVQDDFRERRKRWIAWILALVLVVAAIALNSSRSGIEILVVGSAFWLSALAFRKHSPLRLALVIAFLLLLLAAFLAFSEQTFQTYHFRDFSSSGGLPGLRWRIFHDALGLIHDSPWCGIGFGNMESLFAIFRNASLSDSQALYPESDWLWLWAEVGWPAVVLAVLGVAVFVRPVFPLRKGTNQRYRLAALTAAMLFAIRGIVDVSGHQVGTAFAAIFLLGLAVHRPLSLKASRWVPMFFRIVGLGLLIAGLSFIVAARGVKLLPGSVGVSNAKRLSAVTNREHNFSETIALTTVALRWAPLDQQLYLARAIAEVELQHTTNAISDFRRARFLEPIAYEVPLAEGNAWLRYRPSLAVTAWREALRRAGPLRPQVYASLLGDASLKNSEVSSTLESIGLSEHDLVLPYLNRISAAAFNRVLVQLLRNDPNLQSFNETEKLALFALWSERGEPEEISRIVEQHPDWLRYGWAGVAKYKASKKDFHTAYGLTQRYGEPVALPPVAANLSLRDLQKRAHDIPYNSGIGYELYRAQMESGQIDDALLTARHFSEWPSSPAYFRFLEAQCWAEKQDWERAWNAWEEFQAAQVRDNR